MYVCLCINAYTCTRTHTYTQKLISAFVENAWLSINYYLQILLKCIFVLCIY